MSMNACTKCGKPARGVVQDVPLTYFCETCCRKVRGTYSQLYEGNLKVSATRAREEYGCSPRDLHTLHCSYKDNPVKKSGQPMRLYLRAEVKYLGGIRRQIDREKAEKQERGALIGKRIELEKVLKIRLSALDAVIRKFLLGDYLTQRTNAQTTLEIIQKRFRVVHRVEEIMKKCPGVHPAAIFDFCVERPQATVLDFEQFKENVRRVFDMEGARILFRVPPREREKLVGTPLQSVWEDFQKRNSGAILKSCLQKWLSKETAEEVLSADACHIRIGRGGEESVMAEKLYQFWTEKENSKLREKRLKESLKAKNLPYGKDDPKQQRYVQGELDCDVEELVGEAEIEQRLKTRHNKMCLCCVTSCKGLFNQNRHELLLPYEEAVNSAINAAAPESFLWSGDYYTDYGFDSDSIVSYFTNGEDDYIDYLHENILDDIFY